jgi:hypothetical protein
MESGGWECQEWGILYIENLKPNLFNTGYTCRTPQGYSVFRIGVLMKKGSSQPILLTGASSGIGNHITHFLASKGHLVYGGARKDADMAALARDKYVIPVKLDVRNPQLFASWNYLVGSILRNKRGSFCKGR